MEKVVVSLHSSELIGTCDATGECPTLETQIAELEAMGMEQEAVEVFIDHRQAMCAELGKCTLYFGAKSN